MSEHYYSKKPNTQSEQKTWTAELRGHTMRLTSDRGVFSKHEVDFGSKMLIEHFEFPETEGDLLDVGCGYGPIGLTLAKEEPSRTIHLIDVNERACTLARINARQNHIENAVVYESDEFEHVPHNEYAGIVTNPPIRAGKALVFSIYEQAHAHLTNGGDLWVVIQKKQGAPSTLDKLAQLFDEVETVAKNKGYFIIRARKN
ncbi:class I SAM-dependent methyltransferase [Alkalicoccobacillus murimartini]|uniref:16S rRNA (Guanine1207-N2)-methyltransferase n=1 Tax=Alkalicoccobacillus murimartini TaxID=171685 RepID=A0ABT9YN40_9BACI|nr:class I SAM-dependent methyltransferase [Alkalicoccobacillus murimartini]MDQ0209258.1 16S rRNA (guanine1207-N2)-methyltransferase [Alkalicoccobacillus murimartini]